MEAVIGDSNFSDKIFANRNTKWADILVGVMRDVSGNVLVAAGAGHFAGRNSVLELLKGRGWTIERVQ